jgi:hypothetical protein
MILNTRTTEVIFSLVFNISLRNTRTTEVIFSLVFNISLKHAHDD